MPDYNPLNNKDLENLKEAVIEHNARFDKLRQFRLAVLRQIVTHNLFESGSTNKVPTNFLEMALSIHERQLVSSNPQVLFTTPHKELKRTARLMELSVNKTAKGMKLKDTLRMWHKEAMIGLGVCKVGLVESGAVDIDGVNHKLGQPFVDVVDLDNYAHDLNSHHIRECDFIADKYRVPYLEVMESDLYDKSVLVRIQSESYNNISDTGSEKASSISRGPSYGGEDYRRYVELWDIYLPHENIIVTIPVNGPCKPLRIVEWEGPESGPYVYLAFSPVPANSLPVPPAANWYELHILANQLFRKLTRQAQRAKILYGSRGGDEEDADLVRTAPDGTIITMNDPDSVKPIRYPGPDQNNLAFFLNVHKLFSYFAGNMDVMGGLGPQAETLGQEQMLGMNSSQRLRAMREISLDGAEEIMRALAWYKWTDPLDEVSLAQEIPGTGITIQSNFTPEDKLGEFIDYNMTIEPYSLHRKSPEERLQVLGYIMNNFVGPNQQQITAQGGIVRFDKLFDLISRYTHMDEVKEMIQFLGMEDEVNQVGQTPGAKSNEPRRYIRESVSGKTKAGVDNDMIQNMLATARGQQNREEKLVGS